MLTVGPRLTIAPLARSSDPTTAPYLRARDGSNVAASDTAAGIWVTPVRPSPTPSGPSSSPICGMHRLASPEISKTYVELKPAPVTMLILSGRVICASSIRTRWPIDRDWLSHGQVALVDVPEPAAEADALQPRASDALATSTAKIAAILRGCRLPENVPGILLRRANPDRKLQGRATARSLAQSDNMLGRVRECVSCPTQWTSTESQPPVSSHRRLPRCGFVRERFLAASLAGIVNLYDQADRFPVPVLASSEISRDFAQSLGGHGHCHGL